MYDYFTPDGIMVICMLVIIVLCTIIWILIKARRNNGIAEIPSQLLFGWDGAAWESENKKQHLPAIYK